MNSEEEILDAVIRGGSTDLAAVVAWLTLSPSDWCVIGGAAVDSYAPPTIYADRLDVATDREPGSALLSDLAAEGFAVRVDARAQLVRLTRPGNGHRLRIVIHHGPAYQGMPGRASRRAILGTPRPVASLEDLATALLWQRADGGIREQTEAEMHLFRLAVAAPAQVDALLPADLRSRVEADRARALTYPNGDGWGEPCAA